MNKETGELRRLTEDKPLVRASEIRVPKNLEREAEQLIDKQKVPSPALSAWAKRIRREHRRRRTKAQRRRQTAAKSRSRNRR